MAKSSRESKVRILETKAEVMSTLGGIHPVAALTGADWKNVETWSRAKACPSRYFLVMWFALLKKGVKARPELWGMVTPSDRQKALLMAIAVQKELLAS